MQVRVQQTHFPSNHQTLDHTMQITAKSPKSGKSFSVDYPMPDTLAGLVEKFTEKGVYDAATDRIVVNIQNVIRNGLNKGDVSDADMTTAALSYQPGQRAPRETRSPFERLMGSLGNLTPEQKSQLLAAVKKAA